jgi:hypothetical protein
MIGESLFFLVLRASKSIRHFYPGVPLHFTPGYQHATPLELNSQFSLIIALLSNFLRALFTFTKAEVSFQDRT